MRELTFAEWRDWAKAIEAAEPKPRPLPKTGFFFNLFHPWMNAASRQQGMNAVAAQLMANQANAMNAMSGQMANMGVGARLLGGVLGGLGSAGAGHCCPNCGTWH